MNKHQIIRILVARLKPKRRQLAVAKLAMMSMLEVQRLYAKRMARVQKLRWPIEERIQPVVPVLDAYTSRR